MISRVEMWEDPGFTEGSIEVPSKDNILPTPYATIDRSLIPSTANTFDELAFKGDYIDYMNICYIRVTYELNNSLTPLVLYGWVDSVSLKSDTVNFPQTVISWHIDYWRTYLNRAVFGSGIVKRRAELGQMPPQPYPYRFIEHSGYTQQLLTYTSNIWWVIVNLTVKKSTEGKLSELHTWAIPIDTDNTYNGVGIIDAYGKVIGHAPSLDNFISGVWDEKLKIDPEAVFSAFLSPIPPNNLNSNGRLEYWVGRTVDTYAYYDSIDNSSYKLFDGSLAGPVSSTDTSFYKVTGFDGEVIGELPWGIQVKDYTYRMIVDATSAYIQVRFKGIESRSLGVCFTVPLIPLTVGANSWSSYVYSGAREADLMSRKAQMESAERNALGSVVSGVTGGAMMGSVVPGLGTVAGAALGATTAVLSSTIGLVDKSMTNDAMQDVTDYQKSNQTDNLLMQGTGFDVIKYGQPGLVLREYQTDAYSHNVRDADIRMYGAHVDEPTDNCSALLEGAGPIQIDNLVVRGNIPVEAKRFIKNRLANGVVLK